jgi:hypothetical protein
MAKKKSKRKCKYGKRKDGKCRKTPKRRTSTKKGQVRKTARRAYVKTKAKKRNTNKADSAWNF